MRALIALAVLLSLAACDTLDEDYAGIVEVSLVPDTPIEDLALRLVAVEDTGCERGLRTDLERGAATRRVTVEGIGPEQPCEAIIPASAEVALDLGPELPGGYAIEVRHAGATDLYQLDLANGPPVLTAVRTSTTRLAAP